jgi:hypothetical protein
MKPLGGKVAVVGLLFLLLLSSSLAVAGALPNPPDRSAPANNQTGQLPNAQPFNGGVFLVKDGSTDQNVSASEFVVEFFCIDHGPYISKQFETSVGESISGPLSTAQASGVSDAMNSVRPPRLVNLTVVVGGLDEGGNITYVMTGMTYNVTTYSVWVTTQQSPPAEQRAGYIVVSVPERPQINETSQDLAGSSCSDNALSKSGPGWTSPALSLGHPFSPFSTPPEGGLAPILSYGAVRVLSSAGAAGAAVIRPGENVTFLLPPGSYSAVADVTLFGLHFSVGSGTYSSPAGGADAQFTVSLTSVYSIWYGLELLALAIVVVVVLLLNRWLHLWRALVHASRYFSRVFRSGWRRLWD